VDAGCHLNPRGRQRLEKYVARLTPEAPILEFKYNGASKDNILQAREVPDWNNEAWTKEDLFVALGVELGAPIRADQTYHANTFMLLNGPKARQFLSDWVEVFSKDWAMIDDTPSQAANAPFFKEHRHDQSIFSILCNRHQVIDIDAREIICWAQTRKPLIGMYFPITRFIPSVTETFRAVSSYNGAGANCEKKSPNSAKGWRLNRSHD
jgi:hypothetical protein